MTPILPDIAVYTGFHRISQDFTGFQRISTGFHRISQDFTEYNRISQNFTGFHPISQYTQDITGYYRDLYSISQYRGKVGTLGHSPNIILRPEP